MRVVTDRVSNVALDPVLSVNTSTRGRMNNFKYQAARCKKKKFILCACVIYCECFFFNFYPAEISGTEVGFSFQHLTGSKKFLVATVTCY